MSQPRPRLARPVFLAALVALVAVVLAACGSSSGGGSKRLALVAYSTPQAAFAKLIPAFEATPDGKGWSFSQSYGASGDQSRAVAAGPPPQGCDVSLARAATNLARTWGSSARACTTPPQR